MDTIEASSYWDPVEAYKKYIPLPPPVNLEGTVDEKIKEYKKICKEIGLSVDLTQNYHPEIYRQVYFCMPEKYIKIKLELSGVLDLVPAQTPEQELMKDITFNATNETRWADERYYDALFILKSKLSNFMKTSKSVKIKNYAGYKLFHQQIDETRLKGGQKYEVVELESLPLGSHPYLSTDGRASLDAIAAYREGAVWNGLSEKYRKEKMELVVAVRKFHEMCGEQGYDLPAYLVELRYLTFGYKKEERRVLEKKLAAVQKVERLKEMNLKKKREEAEEVKPTEEEKKKRREAGYAKARATWALKKQKAEEEKQKAAAQAAAVAWAAEKEKEAAQAAAQAKAAEKEAKLKAMPFYERNKRQAAKKELTLKKYIEKHSKL